jgi:hypothetical protein
MTARKKPDSSDEAGTLDGGMPTMSLFNMLEGQLALWRHSADLSRRLFRRQQDEMLKLWRVQLAQFDHAIPKAEGSASSLLSFTPMLAAMKAAEQMAEAALEAQRDALDATRPR